MHWPRVRLLAELLLLFVAVPAAMAWGPLPRNPIPLLLVASVAAFVALRRDPSFDRQRLWNAAPLRAELPGLLLGALLLGPLLWLLARWLAPDETFGLLRQRPLLWLLIMVAYPVVSVYPQELLYRALLLHRYRELLRSPWLQLVVSAALFSFGHVFFRVPAVVLPLTFAGGLLFAWRYRRTGSLLVTAVEHALFGDLIFTVGLGRFFFHRG